MAATSSVLVGLASCWIISVPITVLAELVRVRCWKALFVQIPFAPHFALAALVGAIAPTLNCAGDIIGGIAAGEPVTTWSRLVDVVLVACLVYPALWWSILYAVRVWEPFLNRPRSGGTGA